MIRLAALAAAAILLSGCTTPGTATDTASRPTSPERIFIVGQDVGAIRGYVDSGCCPAADGTTAYIDFYEILDPDEAYGGLGIDETGAPTASSAYWGAGDANAYVTGTEFGARYLAIGVSIVENQEPGGLDGLVAGRYDAEIAHLARFARTIDGTILLRIGYEFDGFWNQGYHDAPRFVAAYRRIVDGIRAAGATNVEMVWQGAASTTDMVLDQGHHDQIADWYPGDDYVDWVGLSWFMKPDEQPGIDLDFAVLTPQELADELLTLARARGKPVIIAEASPQGYDLRDLTESHHVAIWDGPAGSARASIASEDIWAQWFQPMFDYMNANADVIRGLAYINVRWDDQPMWGPPYDSGYWGDTRLEANDVIAERFSAAISAWRERDD